ncbi:DNA-packaging protein [Brevundimonas sp.]|uniref:DNA-packaging protein n=1 Tax=Brevundimonas sp. TaxID=1871086 RepID=UPI003F6EA18C
MSAMDKNEEIKREALRLAYGFIFHREDPLATFEAIEAKVEETAEAGDIDGASKLMRCGMTAVRFWQTKERLRRPATPMPTPPSPEPEHDPAPPVELRPAQTPPASLPNGEPWRTWLFIGGRGAGKTRAGAEWLADQAEALGAGGRLALVGPTIHDVREVMIEGVSGIRSLPRWTAETRPVFESSRRRLIFPNGCIAYAFSAEDPDSLRGPQFSAAWADEFCAWPSTGARGAAETLALLRMGLRLPYPDKADATPVAQAASDRVASVGHPRLLVTTTPKPVRALVRLRDEASCALTHAATADNAAHLAPGFVEGLRELYGGTRREAQELDGRIVDIDGALFTAEMMMRARQMEPDPSPLAGEGKWERLIVAIDPPATATGDACGIIAAGSRLRADGVREAVVLADRSAHGLSPEEWARRAVALAYEVGATQLVAEVNQGGDMVASVLKAVDKPLPLRMVRASKGKVLRAEPVAALYEQGRVRHAGLFEALEEELMMLGAELGEGSLDRADALVWAVTDLLLDRPGERGPRIRVL